MKPYKGKDKQQVSKYFGKYLDSIGIYGRGALFHGIRHSIITKRWAAEIPEPRTAAVGKQRGKR